MNEPTSHPGWIGAVVGTVVGGLVLVLILQFVVVLNVYNAQSRHEGTLYHIDAVTRELRVDELAINRLVKEIDQAATNLEAGQSALCAAIPGCHLP